MRRYCILSFVLVLLASTLRAQTTQREIKREVASLQAMVKKVNGEIKRKKLARRDTSLACPGAPLSFDVVLHTDRNNTVRAFDFDGGTSDQSAQTRYIYDADGRLRYAVATRGAVNGTSEREEVFYRLNGSVFHRNYRKLAGPGYTFAAISPILDPAKLVSHPCGE